MIVEPRCTGKVSRRRMVGARTAVYIQDDSPPAWRFNHRDWFTWVLPTGVLSVCLRGAGLLPAVVVTLLDKPR